MTNEGKTELITMRMRPNERHQLDQLAAEYRTTRTSIIRLALKTTFPMELNGVNTRSRSSHLVTDTGAAVN